MTQFLPALLALLMHGSFGLAQETSSGMDGRGVHIITVYSLARHASSQPSQDTSRFIAAYIAYLKEEVEDNSVQKTPLVESGLPALWVPQIAITAPTISGVSPRDGPDFA